MPAGGVELFAAGSAGGPVAGATAGAGAGSGALLHAPSANAKTNSDTDDVFTFDSVNG